MKNQRRSDERESVPPAGLSGPRGGGRREGDLASHFVDRLNKSIKAHWSTLIELHK